MQLPSVRPRDSAHWWVGFLGFVLLGTAWLVGNPLYASPDEPDHVTHAAAAVHGELIGRRIHTTTRLERVVVRAPYGVVSPRGRRLCFAHQSRVSAQCQRLHPFSGRLVTEPSNAGLYFPPYYAVVGLPSLPEPSPTGVYLMRAMSLLACAALFGIAWWGARLLRSPLAVLGLLFAATPMVVFLSSVVNPNAVEIAGGLAFWAPGLALVEFRRRGVDEHTGRLVAALGVSGGAMLLMRPTSPFWLALIIGLLAALAGKDVLVGLFTRRDVRIVSVVFVLLAAANLIWTLSVGALPPGKAVPPRVGFFGALSVSLQRLPWRSLQYFGVFGWLDTKAPLVSDWIWWLVLAALTIACLVWAALRWRIALLSAIAITLVVPLLIEAHFVPYDGWIWQGRYTLPFAVGIPLIAAIALSTRLSRRAQRRALAAGAGAWAVGQLASLAKNQERYQHGLGHGANIFTGRWLPPGGPWPVVVLAVLGCAWIALASFGAVIDAPP